MNLDTVLIESYGVDASIGVFDWEKEIQQRLVFDLKLFGDFSLACQSDDINHAVNYAAVCAEIDVIIGLKHYELLEALAEQVAQHLLNLFLVDSVALTIRKPGAVARAANVGVHITRGKRV
ncbi:MAG: dihydroneopterin aldolase [Oleiphilaceae bacterium]|jgi:dihydroneopterin aldolase